MCFLIICFIVLEGYNSNIGYSKNLCSANFMVSYLLFAIMAEAQAFVDALMATIVNTVVHKPLEFSPDRIEYWFIATEAEFNLHVPAITQDQTRYSHVVAALKGQVMDRVMDIMRNPQLLALATRPSKIASFLHLTSLP